MRRTTLLITALLCLAAFPAAAQGIQPTSLAGWSDAGMPPAADFPEQSQTQVLAEYGFASFDSHRFTRGADTLEAAVYKLKDPSGAYGLYSFLRTPDMAHADYTEHSSMSSERALVLFGNLVLDIRGTNLAKFEPEVKSLVATIAPKAHEGPLPTLWEHLPQRDMIERTDHYILGPRTLDQLFPAGVGDSLGFSTGAEAELAHYRLRGRDATLLIADFPTPQIAAQKLADLQKKFNVNGSNSSSGSPVLYAGRSLTLLAIVSGASTQAEANHLLSQVQSGTELTWDEPTFQFKEPTIEAMIVGTIVGAGTICMFALVAGVSFGGLRLVVKRLWPGKIFDRNNHLQVLQLGLGSKPINSDDFYGYSAPTAGVKPVDKNLPDRVALRIFR
ncbi:MAG TPA: DUF6599 family protein [Candidatus Acidoferrales bacterium]|nr:DUF6599 family protein [Candidatus Acidoferrales bacterium]